MKEISASIIIPFSRELIFPPAYPSVRDTLARIHRESPRARFTFELSGGSKSLCMAILAVSSWLDGDVYSSFDESAVRNVPIPDRSVRSLLENLNYKTILAILIYNSKKDGKTSLLSRCPGSTFSNSSGQCTYGHGQRGQNWWIPS